MKNKKVIVISGLNPDDNTLYYYGQGEIYKSIHHGGFRKIVKKHKEAETSEVCRRALKNAIEYFPKVKWKFTYKELNLSESKK
jgi:hypothetical protein